MRISSAIQFLPLFVFFSCSSDSPFTSPDEFVNKNSRVSECGGFSTDSKRAADPDTSTVEKLIWTYDAKIRTLTVLNTRVSLNCCGKHSITASRDEDAIVVSENDQPLDQGRCKCVCLFDFSTEIGGLSAGTVNVRLELTVDATLFKKWSGPIQLTEGSGEIMIPKVD
jgi:hypothetical protein